MPELPEVETIVRMLAPFAQAKRIELAELRLGRLLLGESVVNFAARLKNQKIHKILRRGKYIIFELENLSLIIHLGMTGQLTFSPKNPKIDKTFIRTVTGLQKATGVHPVDKHTHLLLHLEKGERILFRDPRTFGKIILVEGLSWQKHSRIQILGPEPLEIDPSGFLADNFPITSNRPIKALILDQNFLAGVGNIYADEALFGAGINPSQVASSLSKNTFGKLLLSIQNVLKKGIENSGTTFSDYRKPDGSKGQNQERLQVYGRGGEPCRKCKTILKKTTLAQRGTVFCPHCQKISPSKK